MAHINRNSSEKVYFNSIRFQWSIANLSQPHLPSSPSHSPPLPSQPHPPRHRVRLLVYPVLGQPDQWLPIRTTACPPSPLQRSIVDHHHGRCDNNVGCLALHIHATSGRGEEAAIWVLAGQKFSSSSSSSSSFRWWAGSLSHFPGSR